MVAGSTLSELGDAVLFVNSDLYTAGSRSLSDVDLPSVISGLNDATFTLRGYPESNRQKLLLSTVSRFVERAAWMAGDDPDFSDSWFVVYRPPEGPHPAESDPKSDLKRGIEGGVALLAVETESRV